MNRKLTLVFVSTMLLGACSTPDIAKFESATQTLGAASEAETIALKTKFKDLEKVLTKGKEEGRCAEISSIAEIAKASKFIDDYQKFAKSAVGYSEQLVILTRANDDTAEHSKALADSVVTIGTAITPLFPPAAAIAGAGKAIERATNELGKAEVYHALDKTLRASQPIVSCAAEAADQYFSAGDFYNQYVNAVESKGEAILSCEAGEIYNTWIENTLLKSDVQSDLQKDAICSLTPTAALCQKWREDQNAQNIQPRSPEDAENALATYNTYITQYEAYLKTITDLQAWAEARRNNFPKLGTLWKKWAAEHALLSQEVADGPVPWRYSRPIPIACGTGS